VEIKRSQSERNFIKSSIVDTFRKTTHIVEFKKLTVIITFKEVRPWA